MLKNNLKNNFYYKLLGKNGMVKFLSITRVPESLYNAYGTMLACKPTVPE